MSKLEELKKLREDVNLIINDLDNYPKDEINVIVSNHNCLMDIFYLPMSLPEEIVSLISARLVYKNENDRKDVINRYLHAMPIEAHGGRKYANICLEQAAKFLQHGKSVNIFPEGAYVPDKKIFRGHTGASRLVFAAKELGNKINLVPISINVSKNGDLDNYKKIGDNVEVTILPAIDYKDTYYNYRYATTKDEKNELLHQPIDIAMKCIADNLGIPYVNNYIELRAKGNVMFEDGSVIDVNVAQEEKFINQYNQELNGRVLRLLKNIKH